MRDRSQTRAFGTWPSARTASDVAAGKLSLGGLQMDGGTAYWIEGRPAEAGRQVLVAFGLHGPTTVPAGGPGGGGHAGPVDVSPPDVSIRSRVHEYGGGAVTVVDGAVFYSDQADQRLYRYVAGEAAPPIPLTPPSPARWSHRWADGRLLPGGRWFVCVEEDVPVAEPSARTTHRLVAVATDGSLEVVALDDGHDFYAAPRPSGAAAGPGAATVGSCRLAWLTWEHPAMPWDGSELWTADVGFGDDGTPHLGPARVVAGGPAESIGQPRWLSDGTLCFVSDRTGWWVPWLSTHDDGGAGADGHDGVVTAAMVDDAADYHGPDWVLGQSTMAELADGTLVARRRRDGLDRLVHLVPSGVVGAGGETGWTVAEIDQPCVSIAGVVADGMGAVVLGTPPDSPAAVMAVDPAGRMPVRPLSTSGPPGDGGPVAVAEPFTAASPTGPVHGLFYAPPAGAWHGPAGERPPLVVFCHGGPTASVEAGYDPVIQFFAARGLAVAAVDYRGSSGYGRAYREQLAGAWGEADVDDCVAFADGLASDGRVDGRRMAIRGTSAGGMTALAALVRADRFAGAVAWYGVTDLESLAADTHDFESRYLDGLVGPFPGALDTYRRRSPSRQAARTRGAVLLLAGRDDPVVPLAQAERYATELRLAGVPCELRIFDGEAHGFRRASTIEESLGAELSFYGRTLGFTPAGTG